MSGSKKKSKKGLIIALCVGLFVVGYVAGTFFPLPVFGDNTYFGAMRRPGGNTHRQ